MWNVNGVMWMYKEQVSEEMWIAVLVMGRREKYVWLMWSEILCL